MFAANWVARRLLRLRVPPYIPGFKQAFQHFCLHAGACGEGVEADGGSRCSEPLALHVAADERRRVSPFCLPGVCVQADAAWWRD